MIYGMIVGLKRFIVIIVRCGGLWAQHLFNFAKLFLPFVYLELLALTGVRSSALSPAQGLFWGFCLGILSGVGPFCVQLFAPPQAFNTCGCPAKWHGLKCGYGGCYRLSVLFCFKL